MRALVLDNNEEIARQIQEFLSVSGISTDIAFSYLEAMEKTKIKYDILFLDYRLNGSGFTGIDFAKEYSLAHPDARIVVISAYEPAMWIGVEEYVPKGTPDFHNKLVQLAKMPSKPNLDELVQLLSLHIEAKKDYTNELKKYANVGDWVKSIIYITTGLLAFGGGVFIFGAELLKRMAP